MIMEFDEEDFLDFLRDREEGGKNNRFCQANDN